MSPCSLSANCSGIVVVPCSCCCLLFFVLVVVVVVRRGVARRCSLFLLLCFMRCAPISQNRRCRGTEPATTRNNLGWQRREAEAALKPHQSSIPLGPKQPRGRNSREAEARSLHRLARAIERVAALRATIWQISAFAATQRPRADVFFCRGGAVSCRGWPCPSDLSRPPMCPPFRECGFLRHRWLAHDAPLPRDAAPPSDPLQITLGDPSLAHHPFHGRRVSCGRTVPLK